MRNNRQILRSQKSCLETSKCIKVVLVNTISGNKATGYGTSWEKALRNAINHYKKQYGHTKNLAILIDE